MQEIIIRKATEEDFEIIQHLSNQLGELGLAYDQQIGKNWAHSDDGIKYFKERINGEYGVCFVAENAGAIVGIISGSFLRQNAWTTVKKAEIDNLFIKEQLRGKGVGKLLIKEFFQWAKQSNVKRVRVSAFAGNEKAIMFYEREGFSPYELILERNL